MTTIHFPLKKLASVGLFLACTCFAINSYAQQLPDTSRFFNITASTYPIGEGPMVFIDAAHNNFHTLDGRYTAFGNILQADGYQTASQDAAINEEILAACDIYVISNPLHESNVGNWMVPTPSAFTIDEITALENWVRNGGSLFLIADHMPFAGAAQDLARVFGFEYLNSFAMDDRRRNFDRFTKRSGLLHEQPMTAGVDSVVTFTGSAFLMPNDAQAVISLDEHFTVLLPIQAWDFTDDTPFVTGRGLHQLAYRDYGQGKVFMSGEAAMFSAQLAGSRQFPMGLNNPAATANIQLLRQIIHWLAE